MTRMFTFYLQKNTRVYVKSQLVYKSGSAETFDLHSIAEHDDSHSVGPCLGQYMDQAVMLGETESGQKD